MDGVLLSKALTGDGFTSLPKRCVLNVVWVSLELAFPEDVLSNQLSHLPHVL